MKKLLMIPIFQLKMKVQMNEYIPPFKRQNLEDNESKEKVEIKFENGEWVLSVINNNV